VPRTGPDLSLSVRRRRPTFVDRELHLVAAAPAAKTGAALGDAALVEEADVQGVAAADERVGVDLIAIGVADVELPQPRGHCERNMRVAALVIFLEPPRERERGRRQVRRQFSAAPLDASKTRTPSGAARR
jgi:hypothetical protein